MKKLYFIKEKSGKWNFCLVVNGKKVLNSANQGYSRRVDCEKIALRNIFYHEQRIELIEITRKDFNALFKKKKTPIFG